MEDFRKQLASLTKSELIEFIIAYRLEMEAQIAALTARIAELESKQGKGSDAPAFVRPNRPDRPKRDRKKRAQSSVRRREKPTEVVVHAVDSCPDCGQKLADGWAHRRRQVIEIPVAPVRVIDHVIVARYCGVCHKRCLPQLDLSDQVVGKNRFGVVLTSLVGYLKTVGRMPVRRIQALLKSLYGLDISVGEICELLHDISAKGARSYADLLSQVRRSRSVNADETGWREDGINGYWWTFSTPTVRYFTYRKSRAGQVVEEVLGDAFTGVLGSDFYGGYNIYHGEHQRCWAHMVRDLKKLAEAYPEDEGVQEWVKDVTKVYEEAKDWVKNHKEALSQSQGERRVGDGYAHARAKERRQFRAECQKRLHQLAEPLAKSIRPERVLAERIERHLPELFTFVEHLEVAPDNNAAERSLRPCVINRKVSGGTRSPEGSKTQSRLLSLFGTWTLRKLDALDQCRRLLMPNNAQFATA